MPTINGKVCVVDGVPVDKVFSNGKQVYGRNLLPKTSGPFVMGYGIPNTTWDTTNQVSGISLPVTAKYAEVLPQGTGFPYTWMPGVTYTQSIYISTDAPLTETPISFTWFTDEYAHDTKGSDNLVKVSTNVYRAISTYTWPSNNYLGTGRHRNADLYNLTEVFDFTKGTFLQFYKPKLEQGLVATPHSPAPEDVLENYIAAPKNLTATVIDLSTEKLDWE